MAAKRAGRETYRTSPLDDRELYDLTADPTEGANRWTDPDLHDLRAHLRMQLKHDPGASSVPEARLGPGPTHLAGRRARYAVKVGALCCIGRFSAALRICHLSHQRVGGGFVTSQR